MALPTAAGRAVLSLILFSAMAAAGQASFVGVNYGRVANNLPPPSKVVELLKSRGVSEVKLYDADPAVLSALAGTDIGVVIAMQNELLSSAAARPSFALAWVKRNVAPWLPSTRIRAIAVGNEVFSSPAAHTLTPALVPAMTNLHAALFALRLDHIVKLSSPIALTALQSSFPPSAGAFRPDLAASVIQPMLRLLNSTGSYLMVNAYPFFAYSANSDVISLDYALFRPNSGVPDGDRRYYNLLDAQLDAVAAAAAALGFPNVDLVVSETGWPSKGDSAETGAGVANAAAYNANLARRVIAGDAGSPARPAGPLGVYLFALFNENQKPGPASERNYGLFYPDEGTVYDVQFRPRGAVARRDQVGTGEWCVADPRAGEARLQAALDYACGEGGADCRPIQPGAGCFVPNTLLAHASFAFNSFFQKARRTPGSCSFAGAAMLVSQEPRFGDCVLPAN